jgi:hypothetical protein
MLKVERSPFYNACSLKHSQIGYCLSSEELLFKLEFPIIRPLTRWFKAGLFMLGAGWDWKSNVVLISY